MLVLLRLPVELQKCSRSEILREKPIECILTRHGVLVRYQRHAPQFGEGHPIRRHEVFGDFAGLTLEGLGMQRFFARLLMRQKRGLLMATCLQLFINCDRLWVAASQEISEAWNIFG